ncbi:aspartyl-phosphate phosphatase Spo0E family protein [Clostridium thailandense]|uniref:Aspartyl-phosphate phosphatase Spo0E family protein n=1 Tax=Clostridium thailandense TaxID=2794346 RepID=A0A949TRM0_9CLOT|nr:aspartyl-phosphate phosphatase Spo0E family protein [Clostridium thailandense]MCH5135798.1 aspartyl-phosphate phosphatase Spo0E family protein [Clostridiaceae bacterium UIB06]
MKKELIRRIEKMRGYMHDLISRKGSLTDPEVILASQMLDNDLNEYNRLLN